MGAKPLHIRIMCNIRNRIRYLISEKSSITDIISHNFARITIDSYSSLVIEKTF